MIVCTVLEEETRTSVKIMNYKLAFNCLPIAKRFWS